MADFALIGTVHLTNSILRVGLMPLSVASDGSQSKERGFVSRKNVYLLISVSGEMCLTCFGLLALKDCVVGLVPSRFLHISIL